VPDQEPVNQAPEASGEEAAIQAANSVNEELKGEAEAERAIERGGARTAGCTPATLAIIGLAIVIIVALAVVIIPNLGSGTSSSPAPTNGAPASSASTATPTSEAPPSSEATSSPAAANLDGDWVLVSGLMNPLTDMPFACSGCSALTVTVDPPEASIDISGTTITGGEYKTGFIATLAGDKCVIEQEAKIDATVSGGVDLNKNYGTLVIDGTPTAFHGCDANYQPIPATGPELGHFSRLFYVKDETLYLCQNLNATFDACTGPNGGATTDPIATFQR